jgi:7-carboxy-7-deazaguanine synthase (Cx14CxxC type)
MQIDKKYKIKEIFYSLQGEGFNTGKAALFIRFSDCNLWSGFEKDRENAICKFCDTDFKGTDGENGGIYSLSEIIGKIKELTSSTGCNFLIFTGGEPLLQLDEQLIHELKASGFYISIETNGTINAPSGIDWITVSPKQGARLRQITGDELKLVFPQEGLDPEYFLQFDFSHFFLQPKYGDEIEKNTQLALKYCLNNPKWRLSLQTHKYLDIK